MAVHPSRPPRRGRCAVPGAVLLLGACLIVPVAPGVTVRTCDIAGPVLGVSFELSSLRAWWRPAPQPAAPATAPHDGGQR